MHVRVLCLAALVLLPGEARAYERYNSGCQTCHGAFNSNPYQPPGGGSTWADDLHDVHRGGSGMNSTCDLCHSSGDSKNPWIGLSKGTSNNPGYGCLGCHGTVVQGQVRGWGLRAQHAGKGQTCSTASCHTTEGVPAGEHVRPPYYGTADTVVQGPCNPGPGYPEDFSGDGVGLDNDGDGLVDGADTDCATGPVCGNGTVEPGETCDPPASCPSSCDDGDACTDDALTGSAATCTAACTYAAVTACSDGDGCCPAGCNATNDAECAAVCGNSVLEAGETCDPSSSCPTGCNDGNACTADSFSGSAAACTASCTYAPISGCGAADGCCPEACTALDDPDCSASCGNGTLEPGETCDPPASCPASCDDGDACTQDQRTGTAANCNVVCTHAAVAACAGGDGCCPAGCTSASDADCSAACGNGVVEAGETCDPPSSCPGDCDDGIACTEDILSGAAETCDAVCSHPAVTACASGDGCCPAGCTGAQDADCVTGPVCGDGSIDDGETCDPPGSCPADCEDGDACTVDALFGSAETCSALCGHTRIAECTGGDGCCPAGCTRLEDADCAIPETCGDGVLDPGERCDGDCPSACDDTDPCTTSALLGSAAACDAQCVLTPVACMDGDGCCSPGCTPEGDLDCAEPGVCGNYRVEAGETCDPPAYCPTLCDDADACTVDRLVGTPETCDAQCVHEPVACASGDGCCPEGCAAAGDQDCSSPPACDGGEGEACVDSVVEISGQGCGCSSGTGGGGLVWALFLLALAAHPRRARAARG